jgi:hypothetical protein
MTAAPWKICSDVWAQDIQRQQEQFRAQLEREADRGMFRELTDRMLDRDPLFFRLAVSDLNERLKCEPD